MNIEYWFPTPILWTELDQNKIKRIKSNFSLVEADVKRLLQNGTWGDNITTSFTSITDFIAHFGFCELGSAIDEAVDVFAKEFNIKNKLVRKESWINYQNKYQYQNVHTHPGCDISVCYYLQATPEDGAFVVHPPEQGLGIWNPAQDGETIQYKPRTGLILVFPANTRHSVGQNLTDNTRISVSCNYKFERQQ